MAHINIKEIPEDDDVGYILHNEMTSEYQSRFVTVDENGTCLPERYAMFAESIENFEVRDTDVFVCTYPRSGTTWTQEMVWLIANNLDYKMAELDLNLRFPHLESSIFFDFEKIDKLTGLETPEIASNLVAFLSLLDGPRFIKSHLPFHLLPRRIRNGTKKPKIIYVMRNPKDVCVSLFHFYTLLSGSKATIENFTKVFLADKALYGSYWKHIFGYLENKDLPNLLIIKYEEMKNDLTSVIKKVADFLNTELTDEQINHLHQHLSFESMKTNVAVNNETFMQPLRMNNIIPKEGDFIRTGVVGKYKEELSSDTIRKFDAWIQKNIDGTTFGQEYKYEL